MSRHRGMLPRVPVLKHIWLDPKHDWINYSRIMLDSEDRLRERTYRTALSLYVLGTQVGTVNRDNMGRWVDERMALLTVAGAPHLIAPIYELRATDDLMDRAVGVISRLPERGLRVLQPDRPDAEEAREQVVKLVNNARFAREEMSREERYREAAHAVSDALLVLAALTISYYDAPWAKCPAASAVADEALFRLAFPEATDVEHFFGQSSLIRRVYDAAKEPGEFEDEDF